MSWIFKYLDWEYDDMSWMLPCFCDPIMLGEAENYLNKYFHPLCAAGAEERRIMGPRIDVKGRGNRRRTPENQCLDFLFPEREPW